MSITTKKPPMKETVGAQYVCFVTQTEDGDWQNKFDANVEKTEVVKKIKVSENMSSEVAYASGVVYDSDSTSGNTMIELKNVRIQMTPAQNGWNVANFYHNTAGQTDDNATVSKAVIVFTAKDTTALTYCFDVCVNGFLV